MRAHGQFSPKNTASPPVLGCPAVSQLKHTDFFGVWRIEWVGMPGSGRDASDERAEMVLAQNPEWKESLAGSLVWGDARTEVFGDVDAGEFSLEETLDGTRISALWQGRVEGSACDHIITGTRRAAALASGQTLPGRAFIMRRKAW